MMRVIVSITFERERERKKYFSLFSSTLLLIN
jgi:hypothetical protein